MEIKEFYEKINGDYEGVLARLMKEERIKKFLLKFSEGHELEDLESSVNGEDWEAGFRAAHTMKGVAANLGLSELYSASDVLCELLRPCVRPAEDFSESLDAVREKYRTAVETIRQL